MSDSKLKDMGLLFGMPDSEINQIAEEQKARI